MFKEFCASKSNDLNDLLVLLLLLSSLEVAVFSPSTLSFRATAAGAAVAAVVVARRAFPPFDDEEDSSTTASKSSFLFEEEEEEKKEEEVVVFFFSDAFAAFRPNIFLSFLRARNSSLLSLSRARPARPRARVCSEHLLQEEKSPKKKIFRVSNPNRDFKKKRCLFGVCVFWRLRDR